jgi:PhnB protein
MARVSTYLNFARSTEEAFDFYRSVFGTDYAGPIMRFGDIPAQPGQPALAGDDKNLVMHVALPILGGHVLMGTDAPESMGFKLTQVWGGYFGSLADKYGIRWMFNCESAT